MNNSTNCSTNPFTDGIYSTVAAVAAGSGFLSLVACCFIIFVILLFKQWRYFSQRLVLYLTITAALNGIVSILRRVDYQNQTSAPYTNFCIVVGFFSQMTAWMELNAIICIITFLLFVAFSGKEPTKLEWVFVIFTFVFPLTFNWIPFIQLAYGKAGAWCWIRSATITGNCTEEFLFGEILQLVLWYIPLYFIMIILIVLYVVILVKFCCNRKRSISMYDPSAEAMKAVKQKTGRRILFLTAYPLVFFLLNIPQFIIRSIALSNPKPEPSLWFLSAVLLPLQGGAIAVAFFLDPETRKKLKPSDFRMAYSELSSKRVEEYPAKDDKEASLVTRLGKGSQGYTKYTDEDDNDSKLSSEYMRRSS